MAIKKYGPTTPGRRGMTVTDYSVLSNVAPERSLLGDNIGASPYIDRKSVV